MEFLYFTIPLLLFCLLSFDLFKFFVAYYFNIIFAKHNAHLSLILNSLDQLLALIGDNNIFAIIDPDGEINLLALETFRNRFDSIISQWFDIIREFILPCSLEQMNAHTLHVVFFEDCVLNVNFGIDFSACWYEFL